MVKPASSDLVSKNDQLALLVKTARSRSGLSISDVALATGFSEEIISQSESVPLCMASCKFFEILEVYKENSAPALVFIQSIRPVV